ncbi:uncharacterized protein LOC124158641 isoform X2 [Ischnura elegans]|uniref:uncharacterized protein LOC124158641 isoform X2 n=1 Tax=Ischnura elegans TaxID=197161 RepID=UPI001ED89F10|nr:uncharacterized protein LOC124158641 isoform X2 [Ischnura elegans]
MYWRKRLLSRRWYSICGLMVFGPLILALALLVVANLLLQLLLSSQPPQWAAPFTMHRAAVSHLDTSGRYKVLPFAVVGEDWANVTLHPVCLATHASLGAVSDLLETLNSWAGPASVTVFDSDPSLEGAARFLRLIKQCGPRAFPLVSFHVIGPVGVERWRWTNSSVPSHWWLGGTEDWVGAGDDWCRGETRGRQVKAEKQQVKNETVYPQPKRTRIEPLVSAESGTEHGAAELRLALGADRGCGHGAAAFPTQAPGGFPAAAYRGSRGSPRVRGADLRSDATQRVHGAAAGHKGGPSEVEEGEEGPPVPHQDLQAEPGGLEPSKMGGKEGSKRQRGRGDKRGVFRGPLPFLVRTRLRGEAHLRGPAALRRAICRLRHDPEHAGLRNGSTRIHL